MTIYKIWMQNKFQLVQKAELLKPDKMFKDTDVYLLLEKLLTSIVIYLSHPMLV